jgi:predicted ester cyclase/heme-degrading monooxygenase HmoA
MIAEEYPGIQDEKGVAAFKKPIIPVIQAFPDIQWKIEELISEGDKVVVKWKWQGTNTGPFQQFIATGKKFSNEGFAIYELKNGKIINASVQTDRLSFLQQMEVVPTDPNLLTNKKDRIRFIDKFFVPANARQEFIERMKINMDFIKNLPGFIEDAAYEHTDEQGNLICITIAVWKDEESIRKAKEAVQAEYKKQGFDREAMYKRLNITIDRGIYKEMENQGLKN